MHTKVELLQIEPSRLYTSSVGWLFLSKKKKLGVEYRTLTGSWSHKNVLHRINLDKM